MHAGEARAPRPPRGDPNVKPLSLLLTTEQWRQLRAWAAQEGVAVEDVVSRVVRGALDERPRLGVE